MALLNLENLKDQLQFFRGNVPFDYCIIDNFLSPEIAKELENDFLDFDNPRWFQYKNELEDKKALNDWNQFPKSTYKVLCKLMSTDFVDLLSGTLNQKLYTDPGLHGGGWHIHSSGGNLNPHLDYSIHPKFRMLRKLNLIIYLSENLMAEHGGHLGFWQHSETTKGPGELMVEIQPKFNRAVLFDTTQNSWHGMSRELTQPAGIFRKSLAIYYLVEPVDGISVRERALYAPRESQKDDKKVAELIKMRADPLEYSKAYRR